MQSIHKNGEMNNSIIQRNMKLKVAALLASTVLAACGNGSSPPGSSGSPTPPALQALFSDISTSALAAPFIPGVNRDATPVTFPRAFSKLGEVLGAPLCNAPGGPGCTFGQSAYVGGVVIADFNRDGRNDMYVTNAGDGANALYINQGNDANGVPKFQEAAAQFGAALAGDQASSVTAADVDNDGYVDLYVTNIGFDPDLEAARSNPAMGFTAADFAAAATPDRAGFNRLLRNLGTVNGQWLGFTDITLSANAGGEASSRSATPSFVDFDRDGDLDLFVAAHKNVFFVLEPSHFAFGPTGPLSKPVANPVCLADGDLSDCIAQSGPLLLKNMLKESGTLRFEDTTALLRNAIDTATGLPNVGRDGLPFIDTFIMFDGQWFDYDDDGYQDLVTANDAGVVGVYRNVAGSAFEFVSTSALVSPQATPRTDGIPVGAVGAWMGISHGDVNGDGRLDFYATNAGIGGLDGTGFTQGAHALYVNKDGTRFVDVAAEVDKKASFMPAASLGTPAMDDGTGAAETAAGHFAFGGQMFDMDNDGDLDIVNFGNLFGSGVGVRKATSGAAPFAAIDAGVPSFRVTNRGMLFENLGTATVQTVGGESVAVPSMRHLTESAADRALTGIDNPRDSRGLAIGDLDNDGFPDLVAVSPSGNASDAFFPFAKPIGSYQGNLVIYQNRATAKGNANKALVLRLEGSNSNRNGIGAKVTVSHSGKSLVRALSSNAGHRGNASLEVSVGVEAAASVDLDIRWPNGTVQSITGVPVAQQRTCFVVRESLSGMAALQACGT